MSSAPKNERNPLERFVSFLETDNGQRLAVCVFSIFAVLILLAFGGTVAAIIIAIPFVFFVPGFTVVRLFFWKTTTPEAKFVLSMGLSILVVIFLAVILVFTPMELNSNSARASLVVFSIGAVALEMFVLPANRPVGKTVPQPSPPKRPVKMDKVVAGMLATSLVVSAISLGLIVTAEYPSRTFFAMTDENGRVITETEWAVNSTLTILIQMKNGEEGARNFTLVGYILNSDKFPSYSYSRALQSGEGWNQTMAFPLNVTGNFNLLFDLYIQEDLLPPVKYGTLNLWFAVV